MPLPDRFISTADRFADRYRQVEADANRVLADVLDGDLTASDRRQLRALANELDRQASDLADEARTFLRSQLGAAWSTGATAAQVGRFNWSQAHRSALALLVDDTHAELLANTTQMSRDVKQLVRAAGRLATIEKVGSGTPAKTAGARLADRLRDTGITSVTYADGRNIRASTYAEMLVRSKSAVAFNMGGLNQMASVGIRYVEVVDGADCGLETHDSGNKPNGRILPADVAAAYPIAHPNAIMEGSVVAPVGELRAAYRANWSGRAIEIRTAGGSRLTVGPNHPVFTGRGWVKADRVREGDDVLRSSGHRQMPLMGSLGDVHLNQVPAPVEDVFSALREVGTHTRVVAAPDYFHDDGNFCQGEVDVVSVEDGLLPFVGDAEGIKTGGESVLVLAREPQVAFGGGHPLLDLMRGSSPASGGIPTRVHVSGVPSPGTDLDITLQQACSEGAIRDADLCGQILGALSGEVAVDVVAEVRNVDVWIGHAYDLETQSATYWCDSILVHNCRRDFIPRPDVTSDAEAMVSTLWRSPEQIADQANFEKYLQATSTVNRQTRTPRTERTASRTPRQARQSVRS